MNARRAALALSGAVLLVFHFAGCGSKPGTGTAGGATPSSAPPAAEEKEPAAYTYPRPVEGHLTDVNTGDFDLVDGIAWTANGGAGTVVYVTSKLIASPVLAGAPCPMSQARALAAIRNAGWVEATLDAKGKSRYFTRGTPFGGTGREEDVGGRYWTSTLTVSDGLASGEIRHKNYGGFAFEKMPVTTPRVTEVSESDKVGGKRSDPLGVTPTQEQVAAAYEALRKAALAKDLKTFLALEGFDEKQVAAIRGLDGIDADFAILADRFLTPGETGEFQNAPGYGGIVGTGVNSKGAKFLNFYEFTPCEGSLVLTSIGENAQ